MRRYFVHDTRGKAYSVKMTGDSLDGHDTLVEYYQQSGYREVERPEYLQFKRTHSEDGEMHMYIDAATRQALREYARDLSKKTGEKWNDHDVARALIRTALRDRGRLPQEQAAQ